MELNVPLADPNGPILPGGQVPPPAPQPHIGVALPAPGAVQPEPAPPARRNRAPRGIVPPASGPSHNGAPVLLELAAAHPMHTQQRRTPNFYVPDAQMLFHVLSICDQMMNATDRFLRSSPNWLPIVSQLYIAVLWNVMLLRVFVNSGYGAAFAELLANIDSHLQITECMIPGPLVPFFQSLAAINGPFDWMGDIVPAMPDFGSVWSQTGFHPQDGIARILPIPAIILDQLFAFTRYTPTEVNASAYPTFEWYRGIFQTPSQGQPIQRRLGPQLCGSLYTTQAQFDAARSHWNSALSGGFTRITTTAARLNQFSQLYGFVAQDGTLQLNWFQHVSTVMQKYAQYFNGSAPLKSVPITGLGAAALYGTPFANPQTRDWIYPHAKSVEPFLTSRFSPRREIPSELSVIFAHADHELEAQAEQYATLSFTNMKWPGDIQTQHNLPALVATQTHQGDYWQMTPFRFSNPINLKSRYAQVIASRYHQQAANRAE